MAGKKPRKNPVTVRGAWFPMPTDFLSSRVCAELSPQGVKMFLDLCAQLGRNAAGNGDLSAAPKTMLARGWTSNATRVAALQELLDADLLTITRRGDRRRCVLYAITLWPLDCDFSKLDHGPGSYSTHDWEQTGRSTPPTAEKPAIWRALRKAKSVNPQRVQMAGEATDMNPQWDDLERGEQEYEPVTGT